MNQMNITFENSETGLGVAESSRDAWLNSIGEKPKANAEAAIRFTAAFLRQVLDSYYAAGQTQNLRQSSVSILVDLEAELAQLEVLCQRLDSRDYLVDVGLKQSEYLLARAASGFTTLGNLESFLGKLSIESVVQVAAVLRFRSDLLGELDCSPEVTARLVERLGLS